MQEKSAISGFSNLLESVNFFNQYYQETFFQFPDKKVSLKHLFDERDLKATIAFTSEKSDILKLVFNGMGLSVEKMRNNGVIEFDQLMRQHYGGATMIVNNLGHHSNRLMHFNRFLETIFKGHVHTNFYGTPTNSRGLKPHIDKHDVFVLQVKGKKAWSFYTHKSDEENRMGKAYEVEDLILEKGLEMKEGNLLYVPRGKMHAAKAIDGVSWHLTIGVTGFYWSDYINGIVEDMSSLYADFQKVVPEDISPKELEKELAKRCELIMKGKASDYGFKKFTQSFPKMAEQLDEIVLPDETLLKKLNDNMLFRRTASKLVVEILDEEIRLNLPYRVKPLKLHPRLKQIIEVINSEAMFSAQNFIGLNEDEPLLLTYYLWNNGIIEPISN